MELMLEVLALWLFIGGMFGVPYLTVLLATFLVVKASRTFVVGYPALTALLVPIAIYLLLTHLMDDRQGLNWGYTNLIIAVPAAITLYLGTCRPGYYWAGAAATVVIAYAAWLLVPSQGFTKLF